MIEENLELNTLIGGWYIDETVCDNLLKLWPKIAFKWKIKVIL